MIGNVEEEMSIFE